MQARQSRLPSRNGCRSGRGPFSADVITTDPDTIATGRPVRLPRQDAWPVSEQRSSDMNDSFRQNMLDATRLTRAGRLTDATAFLQRVLRGDAEPRTPGAAAKTAAAP